MDLTPSRELVDGDPGDWRVRNLASRKKRTILRKMGCRAGDLDVTSMVLVDLLARALAKLHLLDENFARSGGIVLEDGSPAPTLALYFSAHNAARQTASRLADHLHRKGDTSGETLEDYVAVTYRSNGDGDEDK